ncbi:MAG: efflux RND transporter periplasmic adaptor subunit [Flammeovirgaceae bacterium]|nr:efflux RND transporter periplasmic adaptor subunit [Flammeovirgaceae bacterium]
MRKYITIGIGIVVLVLGFFGFTKLKETKKPSRPQPETVLQTVFVEKVVNSNVPVLVIESGSLVAKNKIELFSEVQGVMEKTGKEFKPGIYFSQGQVMVKIRSNDHYANLMAQKSNLQNLINAIMADLKLDYPESFDSWATYLRDFDLEKPVPELPTPQSEKERTFITARNIYTSYYNTKNMEIIYQKYTLTAPFSGVVTDGVLTPGTLIRQGQKLGEFISTSAYEMEVSVGKALMSSLEIGKKVKVREPGFKEHQWEGKISRINGKIDLATQTVKVFIQLTGKDLREGMYLEAVIEGNPVENSTEVARNLLVEGSKLYIVKDKKLELVDIEQIYSKQKSVIVRGLKDGDQLVNRPVPGGYSGMEVNIYQPAQ